MYRATPKAGAGCEARDAGRQGDRDGKNRNRDREGGLSVAILDGSVSSNSPEGGLAAKQERLERAARLLGKEGGRLGKG
jgi:hypothetical protein